MKQSVTMSTTGGETDRTIAVTMNWDGTMQHMIDTFRAFLIAQGFHPETINKFIVEEM